MRAWDVVLEVTEQLAAARVTSPAADARWLVCHALDCEASALISRDVDPAVRERVTHLVARRIAGEPVQHITGSAAFRHETLAVGPGVFIPRPETELLVDEVLSFLGAHPEAHRVVELCGGSGAITRSLAMERGGLELHVVERSAQAWPWLLRNLDGLDVDCRLGDMAEEFHDLDSQVDVVVANPPYVPERVRHLLPPEVSRDPDEALFAGQDGLSALEVVREVAGRLLRDGGLVAVEHDESHAREVRSLFGPPEFTGARTLPDLTGRPRHCLARRGRMVG
ncbi:peptide chain release factor N(5)-glutamine methyltransferase [Arachnia propionica]|uniref:Peptide chain release factor N(5)-glutamine methyltransferase n=1 Tax=Arachnia propionica TaxID=1750 RepID=A0A3P1TCY7_9ACTN|nr:peptide chain release factor N(5)-glutamine methyltransferase [Arachnia propionica]RRD07065.1 peptide chain release factor N(5)-glutamine methyltransferase [Arachnia propionica]